MAEFGLIKDHPDSKEILSKLLSGSTPKDVAAWLKLKYPEKNQKHLRLSQKLLNEFTDSQYTSYYDQFQEDLATLSDPDTKKKDKELSYALTHIKPYRERMEELADMQLNTLVTIEKNMGIVLTRVEQMYDLIQNDPTNGKLDNTFIRYMKLLQDGMETIEKIKINSIDNLAHHNFTMQAMQDNIMIMQDAIRETMAEVDPDLASSFMDKLYNKLNELQPPQAMTPSEKLEEVHKFEAQVVGVTNTNDS
jgi:hypothetical protein